MARWTKKEIDNLREYYPNTSWNNLLKIFPGRTKSMLVNMALRLGIYREVNLWSDEEINILKEKYSETPWNNLLQMLPNRTKAMIEHKANRMGFKRFKNKWQKEELEILNEFYSENKTNLQELYKLLPNKTPGRIRKMRHKLGYEVNSAEKWAQNELEILNKFYPTATWEKIYELLPNRTHDGIKKQTSILGIKRIRAGAWSKEEEDILKEYYPESPWDTIFELLPHRTYYGIVSRANSIGLERTREDIYVYFIYDDSTQSIKIGKSNNPHYRLKMIQTGHSNKLALLAIYPEDVEAQLHQLFKSNHIRGEWYQYSPKIEKWIRNNCLNNKDGEKFYRSLDFWLNTK